MRQIGGRMGVGWTGEWVNPVGTGCARGAAWACRGLLTPCDRQQAMAGPSILWPGHSLMCRRVQG